MIIEKYRASMPIEVLHSWAEEVVFKLIKDNGAIIEVTYSDLPEDGQNYAKIMRVQPESLFGIYDHRITVKELVSDLSWKG